MKRSPLRRSGKKTKAWDKARAELKFKWAGAGITWCVLQYEGCWRDVGGFAHSLKRRNITTPELLREAVPCCNSCHQKIELLPEPEMAEIVRKKIRQYFPSETDRSKKSSEEQDKKDAHQGDKTRS